MLVRPWNYSLAHPHGMGVVLLCLLSSTAQGERPRERVLFFSAGRSIRTRLPVHEDDAPATSEVVDCGLESERPDTKTPPHQREIYRVPGGFRHAVLLGDGERQRAGLATWNPSDGTWSATALSTRFLQDVAFVSGPSAVVDSEIAWSSSSIVLGEFKARPSLHPGPASVVLSATMDVAGGVEGVRSLTCGDATLLTLTAGTTDLGKRAVAMAIQRPGKYGVVQLQSSCESPRLRWRPLLWRRRPRLSFDLRLNRSLHRWEGQSRRKVRSGLRQDLHLVHGVPYLRNSSNDGPPVEISFTPDATEGIQLLVDERVLGTLVARRGESPGPPTIAELQDFDGDGRLDLWFSFDGMGWGVVSDVISGRPLPTLTCSSRIQDRVRSFCVDLDGTALVPSILHHPDGRTLVRFGSGTVRGHQIARQAYMNTVVFTRGSGWSHQQVPVSGLRFPIQPLGMSGDLVYAKLESEAGKPFSSLFLQRGDRSYRCADQATRRAVFDIDPMPSPSAEAENHKLEIHLPAGGPRWHTLHVPSTLPVAWRRAEWSSDCAAGSGRPASVRVSPDKPMLVVEATGLTGEHLCIDYTTFDQPAVVVTGLMKKQGLREVLSPPDPRK